MLTLHIRVFQTADDISKELIKFLDNCYTESLQRTTDHGVLNLATNGPQYIMVREKEHFDKTTKKRRREHFHILLKIDQFLKTNNHDEATHIIIRNQFKETFKNLQGNKAYSIAKARSKTLLSYILKTTNGGKDNIVGFRGISEETIKTTPLWEEKKVHWYKKLKQHIETWKTIQLLDHSLQYPPNHHLHSDDSLYPSACIEILKYCRENERNISRQQYRMLCLDTNIITPYEYLRLSSII